MNSPSSAQSLLDLDDSLEQHDLHIEDDNRVCWNKSNCDHPRNWGVFSKYYATVTICWLEMFMTGISSSGTAAAESARMEYHISRTLSYFAFVTIYLLGQTIGGIFCSPISETFGRRTIYIISAVMFCIFSVIVAAIPSMIAVYFGRFFQGVAAAIPATVAFGNFEDMFDAEKRIWIVYGYTLSGMIGLALGPIFSSYVTEVIGWRWVFYISAIAAGASAVLCCFVQESKATQLLQAKVKRLRAETGRNELYAAGGSSKISIRSFVKNSLFRPLQFLVTEPIVFFCAVLCAIAFGLVYGLTEGLTVTYTNSPFDRTFSQTSSSLSFIAILVGEILNILPRIYDQYIFRQYRRDHRRILPESKITSFAIACPALAIGLWIFAWTVPPIVTSVPWPVSMIGLALIGFALNDFSYVLFGYVTDSYGEYAASGVAAISLLRTLAAAVFPLFSYQMFSWSSNYAATILACVATLFAFTPFLFLGYGEKLRTKSKVASNNDQCLTEENDHMDDEKERKSGVESA